MKDQITRTEFEEKMYQLGQQVATLVAPTLLPLLQQICMPLIEKAVKAERERCALVAEDSGAMFTAERIREGDKAKTTTRDA